MRASLVLVAALLGCRDPRLVGALEPLIVPDVVDCGRALVGSSSACSFEVVSAGPTRLSEVALQGEFTGPAEVELAAGENRLTLQFQPQRAGPAEGLVTLSDDEHHVTGLRLVGTGVVAEVCAREPCQQSTFDLETSRCVTTNEPEGTSCAAERCIIDGVCAAGHCVGPPRSCDDQDPCTIDSCSSTQGCLHEARVCPPSTNPCEAPVCDATSGCGFAPVIDGTACGVSDCRTAPICLSGHCELRAAPIGSTCGTPSACRGPGQCLANGTCGPGPSTSPRVAWRFSPPAGRHLVWWTTTHGGRTTVVTESTQGADIWMQVFDANGFVEFSIDLSAEDSTIARVSTVLDDAAVLCVVTEHGPRREPQVSCRDRRTGARLWQRALSSLAIPVNDPVNGRANFMLQRIASGGQGDVVLLVMEGNQTHTLHAIALEGTTGTPQWRVQRHGHGRLFVSRSGETWLTSRPCSGQPQSVTRISSTGRWLHERVVPWALRAMAGDTPIVTTPNQVLQLAPDGSARQVSTTSAEPWSVLWEDDLLTMQSRTAAGTSELLRLDLDGGVRFAVPLDTNSTVLQLLTDGGVATSTSQLDGGFTLRLYSASGALFGECDLSVPTYRVSSERAFGSSPQGLVVYELPGIGAAPSGWPSIDGFNGAFRAR